MNGNMGNQSEDGQSTINADCDANESDNDDMYNRILDYIKVSSDGTGEEHDASVSMKSVTGRKKKKTDFKERKVLPGDTTLTDNIDQETPEDSIITGYLFIENDSKSEGCSPTSSKTFQVTSPGALTPSQTSKHTCEDYGVSSPAALESPQRESTSDQVVTNKLVESSVGPLPKGSECDQAVTDMSIHSSEDYGISSPNIGNPSQRGSSMQRKQPQNVLSMPQILKVSSQLNNCDSSSCHTVPESICSSIIEQDEPTCLTRETVANLGDSECVNASEEQTPDALVSFYNEKELHPTDSISTCKEVSSSSETATQGLTKKCSKEKCLPSIELSSNPGKTDCPVKQGVLSGSEAPSKTCELQEGSQLCEEVPQSSANEESLDEACSSQQRMLSSPEKDVLSGLESDVPKELKHCEERLSLQRKLFPTSNSSNSSGHLRKCIRKKRRSSLPAREHSELSDDNDPMVVFPAESHPGLKKQKYSERLPSCSSVRDNCGNSDEQCNIISAPFKKRVILISMTPSLEELIDNSSQNLVRGFCGGCCLGLSPYEDLPWYEMKGMFCPCCPECVKKGLKEIVSIDFWFKVLLEDTSNMLYHTVYSRGYARRFLRCTRDDFLQDEAVRKRVYGKLRSLIENRKPFHCKLIRVQNVEGIHFRAR